MREVREAYKMAAIAFASASHPPLGSRYQQYGDGGHGSTRCRQRVSSVPLRYFTAVHLYSGTEYKFNTPGTSSPPTGNDGGLGGGN